MASSAVSYIYDGLVGVPANRSGGLPETGDLHIQSRPTLPRPRVNDRSRPVADSRAHARERQLFGGQLPLGSVRIRD